MYKKYFKRLMDIFFSILLIIVLIPVFILITILIKLQMGSPVFFTQKRV